FRIARRRLEVAGQSLQAVGAAVDDAYLGDAVERMKDADVLRAPVPAPDHGDPESVTCSPLHQGVHRRATGGLKPSVIGTPETYRLSRGMVIGRSSQGMGLSSRGRD